MPSINSSNNIINKNLRKRGILSSKNINDITRSVGNIMADNGTKVLNSGNGMQFSGNGRLPFDSRLDFGINMIGFIDSDTDWKVTIYEGYVHYYNELSGLADHFILTEETFTLTADTEYIYVQYTSDDPFDTILTHGETPPDNVDSGYGYYTDSRILYKLVKQTDNSYILEEIYHVGSVYLYIGNDDQLIWFACIPDSDDGNIIYVMDGTWRYNGKTLPLITDVSFPNGRDAKELAAPSSGYIVLHMELDSAKEPYELTANYVLDANLSTFLKDKYEHNYWILAHYTPGAAIPIAGREQFWKGGNIESIAIDNFNDEVAPKPHKKYHHLYIERDSNANSHVTIFEFPRFVA